MKFAWKGLAEIEDIKQILQLLLMATICMLIWLFEILLRDWRGLQWMNYFHIAWLIIPTIIFIWVVRIEGDMVARKHFFIYPLMIFIYFILMSIICTSIWEGIEKVNYRLFRNNYSRFEIYLLYTIPVFLYGFITFIGNLIVARVEKKSLSLKSKLVLFFSPYLIPLICLLVTMFLFTQKYLFPVTSLSPMKEGLDILHWIKSGSFIFAYVMYEGSYYLWLKGRIFSAKTVN